MKDRIMAFFRLIKGVLSHNWKLKIISVFVALILWSFVVYSNPSIMSSKTVSGVEVSVSGQAVLESRLLAVLTDLESISPARVRVEVSQASFANVTPDNIRVELDLSGIRQTGKQSVKLRGTTTTGRVVEVWPESVELEIEKRDQRYVPVNVVRQHESSRYWYDTTRINPATIAVSGPASVVQQVASARVSFDARGVTAYTSRAEQFVLLDAQGQEITTSTLSKSTTSVTVTMDVYPARQLKVTEDVTELAIGEPAEGYEVDWESVEVQPDKITVAGEQDLIDALTELVVEPVDISGAKNTVTTTCKISTLTDLKNISSKEVTVTVPIREKQVTSRFTDISITQLGRGAGLTAALGQNRVDIQVTGPYFTMQALKKGDIIASVDLKDLEVGEHSLPVTVTVVNYPGLTHTVEPESIRVVLTEE